MKKYLKFLPAVIVILVATGILSVGAVHFNDLKANVFDIFKSKGSSYNIKSSKHNPSVFTFNYEIDKVAPPEDGAHFDIPIIPFDDVRAQQTLKGTDFGTIRDAWNYPVRENAYHRLSRENGRVGLNPFEIQKASAADNVPGVPGLVNCRANTSVQGYFKAYFEDVALDTNKGYDDASLGQKRRDKACQVLQDIGTVIKLDDTNVTPDILFMADPGNIPAGALAAASSYFGFYSVGPDNGALHKHIISGDDPTPGTGNFDAFIITNFNGIAWDVDSSLNANTYSFYSVMYHEVLHTLGFLSLNHPVVTTTNVAKKFTSFDSFLYKDSSLGNKFFNDGFVNNNWNLQAPIGAPSPWFITNTVAYRGIKNIVGANPDGIRPVFSPTSWQQGSSLSHFDMNRSGGKTYVMHPSIGKNTLRTIDTDEKEVLCHAGYRVLGVPECELTTPVANNDSILLQGGVSECIKLLQNDSARPYAINANPVEWWGLSIDSLSLINVQPGDVITYFSNAFNCSGVLPTTSGAKLFSFTPSQLLKKRSVLYTVKSADTNRISLPAVVSMIPCNNDFSDYVCNGDFEMGPAGFLGSGMHANLWTSLYGTPDWAGYYGSSYSSYFTFPITCPFQGCIINTSDGSQRAAFMFKTKDQGEGIATQLQYSLSQGKSYKVSLDVFGYVADDNLSILYNPTTVSSLNIVGKIKQGSSTAWGHGDSVVPVFDQTILNRSVPLAFQNNWTHVESIFTANGNYDFLGIHPVITQIFPYDQQVYVLVDNVSIKEYIPSSGKIDGQIYQDLNNSGIKDQNESGLDGVQVGLFQSGSTTPIQTVTTQNIPNLGKYAFSGVADGSYYVALLSETLYPKITEPLINNPILLSGYKYVQTVTIANGQSVSNKNFGVLLDNDSGLDVCTNISGVQLTVPDGMVLVKEKCVGIQKEVDVCPNLTGMQVTVPSGYILVRSRCVPTPEEKGPVVIPMTPLTPLIPPSPCPEGQFSLRDKCIPNIDTPTKSIKDFLDILVPQTPDPCTNKGGVPTKESQC